MRPLLRGLASAVLLALCVGSAYADQSGEAALKDFKALVTLHEETFLKENPVSATGLGDRRYGRLLGGVKPADHARRHQQNLDQMDALKAIDRSALAADQQLNYDLLSFILEHRIARAPYKSWRVPLLADGGFHFNAIYMVRTHLFETAADYRDYLARLKAIPEYFADNIANMRSGMTEGVTMPAEILPGVIKVIESQQWQRVEQTPFWHPFVSKPSFLSDEEWQGLSADGRGHITTYVMPAYQAFLKFMVEEYQPAARDTVGATALPNGDDYYAAEIRYYTNLDLTADDVHQIGLKEVARIRKEMDAIIEGLEFEGSFAEFLKFLRTDPQFYARTPREILMVASYLSKKVDGILPAFFSKLPRQPYSVQPVPAAIAENYTAGRYSGAPKQARRGGEYWVNTFNLSSRPLYALPALTLHEAVPGHHLQRALSIEVDGQPAFRRRLYPHAFGEGWGLYSEKLGIEMGMYETPYDDFGRLTYEMWRACRLVVDTGLHAKGWTRQQALDYLAGNTALSLHEVTTEIDRYIAWPGQALAYKMGELKILELRAKAEAALGADFDIRTFHDAVVSEGGIPLPQLEQLINQYIEREQSALSNN